MELGIVIHILIWLLIAGVLIWAIQAIAAALNLPRVIVIIAQVVIALAFCLMLLRLAGGL